jgi:hypothetical protein
MNVERRENYHQRDALSKSLLSVQDVVPREGSEKVIIVYIAEKISFKFRFLSRYQLFPTRLLTSEDEYRWYWHQMIYFPETINTISTTSIYITDTFTLSS